MNRIVEAGSNTGRCLLRNGAEHSGNRPLGKPCPASASYTPEEARYAEQYAKDACADAAPDLTGERRAYQ